MKKDIIRVGDKVKIVYPAFFDGCRYDNNIQSEMDEVIEKHGREIRDFLDKLIGVDPLFVRDYLEEASLSQDRAVRRVARGVAYDSVRRKMKGGNEKKIFTHLAWEYEGDIVVVQAIKYVHTGKYEPMTYCHSRDGDVDYTPAYLHDRKVHKILDIDYEKKWQPKTHWWIEAKNVEKMQ